LLFNIVKAAQRRVGLISTVHAVIGEQIYNTGLHTTTPDAPDVQRYLAQMRDADTEIAVLEATSHGLAQHRVTCCAFDVAVVTNITHEHLDFHGSYEAYREAKALLFRSLSQAPGASARILSEDETEHPEPVEGYGLSPEPATLRHAQDGWPRRSKSFSWFAASTNLSHLPKTAVLNRDDRSYEYLAQIPVERVIAYGMEEPRGRGADEQKGGGDPAGETIQSNAMHLTASNIRHTPAGTEFDVLFTPRPRVPVAHRHPAHR
jgi:UDP-N-acetylmuramyl pentapeptide synthase